MIILSAPSGGGKTSIAKKLLETDDNLSLSISTTTRKARNGEHEGVDYFFKTRDEFEEMSKQDKFLEHAEIYGDFYGTSKKEVNKILSRGRDILFDIDSKGTYQIIEKAQDQVVSIFIKPPSIDVLEDRLKSRGQDDQDIINQRLNQAQIEIKHAKNYDYIVVNDNFDHAVKEIQNIIIKERKKRSI